MEHKNLSAVATHTMTAAQIITSGKARQFVEGKPHAIIVTARSTEKRKDKLYFLHYAKSSVVDGPHTILPILYNIEKRWSTKGAREQQRELSPMKEIKGVDPIREMLGSKEEKLLHPTEEGNYNASGQSTTRFTPTDCGRYDCSLCYRLTRFGSQIKYAAFLGG